MDKFKKLDQLIEQVLVEKFPLNYLSPANDTVNKQAAALGRSKRNEFPSNWDTLAATTADKDGDPQNISLEDILKTYSDRGASPDVKKFIANQIGNPSSMKIDANEKALIKFLSNPNANTKLTNAQLQSLGVDPSGSIAQEFDKYIASDAETPVGALDMPYRRSVAQATDGGEWVDGKDLTISNTLPQSTIEVFKKGLLDANGDVTEYFGKLQKLGDALAMVGGNNDPQLLARTGFSDPEQAKQFLKDIPADELFNTAVILKTMGRLAKETQGSEAGFVFETFLALMMGGAIVGGRLGAADVVAGKKGERLFSAKQYQDKPGGGQAIQNFIGELGSDKDRIMWFISLAKKRASKDTAFSRIDIYITGVSWDGGSKINPENYIAYDSNGAPFATLYSKSGQWAIPWTPNPDFAIPISPSWADTDSIDSFDKMFVNAINIIGDDVQKAIRDMNVMLNRLNGQTKVYIANKSEDAAETIGDDYKKLKIAITSGIGQIGSEEEKGEFKTKSALSENKFTALDKLIEAVILEEQKKGNQ